MKIIYIHGFLSTGGGPKADLLQKLFPEAEVLSPSLDINPEKALKQLADLILENKNYPIILVGTSLGGFYSCYLAEKYGVPAVLINPSLNPGTTLKPGSYVNHGTQQPQEFLQEYSEFLKTAKPNFFDLDSDYLVLVSTVDEVISHKGIDGVFKKVIWDTVETHRFSNLEKYKTQIQEFCNRFKNK